jgi:iron complex outermembrane recepter protein
MKISTLHHSCAIGAFILAAGMSPASVFAQDSEGEVAPADKTIVVTGSFIRGTPEDAALPVDVFSAETLAASGVSSPLEFIKDLPSVGAVLGDSNQFAASAQGFQGNGSINLRGLDATRTLVLFNGRRTILAPGDGFADTNLLPFFALDRIEILKDGAAATYGSDAIAGVANFITKKNFDGIEVQGDFESIKGSKGNWTSSILVGKNLGRANILAGFGWQHRGELGTATRDFTRVPYAINPAGFSTLGNPGTYIPRLGAITQGPAGTAIAAPVSDANLLGVCAATNGVLGVAAGFPTCRFTFVPFDNLIEREDRYQGYVQLDVELSDSLKFRGEAQYSKTDLESLAYSPSFPPTQGPRGSGSTQAFFVPSTNPGYRAFVTQSGLTGGNADPFTAGTLGNRLGTYSSILFFRPLGNGGNPRDTDKGAGRGSAKNEAWRISGGFEKEFSDTFRAQLYGTYWLSEREAFAPDVIGTRLQNALEGFGGPGCNRATGTAGTGPCQYFNPFINSSPSNPALGLTNPAFVPGNQNSAALISWLQVPNGTFQREDQTVVDLIFSGESGFDLGGGPVSYAFGTQYRANGYSTRPLGNESNLDINPCFREGDLSCVGTSTDGVGSFIFLGGSRRDSLSESVYAFFGEVNVPITDTLELNGAVRYEDYGNPVGSTFNPKGSIRFEPTDWLVLRGSVGTTFRAPLATQVSPNAVTSLAGIQASGNNFKSVDIFGNPNNLGPETAFTYNIGAVLKKAGFTFSVDYWSFDFKDRITTTPAQAIASSVVASANALANCSSVFAPLITFQGGCVQGVTRGNDISRVRTDWVNGPGVKTSGLDFSADFTTDIGPGTASIGANASRVLKYRFDDFVLNNVVVQAGYNAVGFTNFFRDPNTVSKWRGNGYVNYNISGLNLRYGVKYIDGVRDDRCLTVNPCVTTEFGGSNFGATAKDYVQHDFNATYDLEIGKLDAQLQFSVENFTNQDPAPARLEVGYNPFIGNPFGRIFRFGAKLRY